MHFTQILTVVSVAIAGAVASPGHSKPHRPDRDIYVNQENNCDGGSAFCCSPNDKNEYTCSAIGSHNDVDVTCVGIQVCCNNYDGDQDCLVPIKWD